MLLWETAQVVQQLEEHLGVATPPGSLLLGQVVFEPGAIRVSHVTGTLAGPLRASADRDLRPARGDDPVGGLDQAQVKAGDKVTVTLPDGTTVPA